MNLERLRFPQTAPIPHPAGVGGTQASVEEAVPLSAYYPTCV